MVIEPLISISNALKALFSKITFMLANLNQIPKSLPTTRHLGNKSEKSARVMDNWNTEAQMVITWTVNVSHQQELFIQWTAF